MVFGGAVAAPFTFLKTFVMTTGIGSVGLFFTVYSLAAVTLRLAFGTLPDRLGPKRVLLPALLLGAVGLGLLARAQDATGIGVAGLLCGLSHGYAFPILVGMLVARAHPPERGASYAIFTALWDVGNMVASPAFGLVIQYAGYRVMFAAAAALVLGGALAFAVWDRRGATGAGRGGSM
jgi:MFS family permease